MAQHSLIFKKNELESFERILAEGMPKDSLFKSHDLSPTLIAIAFKRISDITQFTGLHKFFATTAPYFQC